MCICVQVCGTFAQMGYRFRMHGPFAIHDGYSVLLVTVANQHAYGLSPAKHDGASGREGRQATGAGLTGLSPQVVTQSTLDLSPSRMVTRSAIRPVCSSAVPCPAWWSASSTRQASSARTFAPIEVTNSTRGPGMLIGCPQPSIVVSKQCVASRQQPERSPRMRLLIPQGT